MEYTNLGSKAQENRTGTARSHLRQMHDNVTVKRANATTLAVQHLVGIESPADHEAGRRTRMVIARYARREAQRALHHEPKLMTVSHVADLLGVNVRTVRRWLDDGSLAGLNLGKGYRIPKPALINFLASRRNVTYVDSTD
jgi:excisionase family DNA binding protein